jgi:hypothetical protein
MKLQHHTPPNPVEPLTSGMSMSPDCRSLPRKPKRQRTAALQDASPFRARYGPRQRLGVRLSSAAFGSIRKALAILSHYSSTRANGRWQFDWLQPARFALALLVVLLTLPRVAQAQFKYEVSGDWITITGYTGPGGAIVIPDTIEGLPVTMIGNQAFAGLTNLTNVTIPDSVTGIGYGAFLGCDGLTSITVPSNVVSITWGAFGACTNLAAITVAAGNNSFSSVDGVLFDKEQASLLQCPGGKAGVYVVPQSVTNIGRLAFGGCVRLKEITVGTNVTSIFWDAFPRCPSLEAITVDERNPTFSSVAGVLFDKEQTTLLRCPERKAGDYQIPETVNSLWWGAFIHCINLTNVTMPDGLVFIGDQVFVGCTGLSTLTIPRNVQSILNWTFGMCTNLTGLYFEGDAPALGMDPLGPPITVYYLPGTGNWGSSFGDRPALPWQPKLVSTTFSLGSQTNRFGFAVHWAGNRVVVVEACTNALQPVWPAVGTNTLSDGIAYFSDPDWTNHVRRFYRVRSP